MTATGDPDIAESWADRLRRSPAARYFAASLSALIADYAMTMIVFRTGIIGLAEASAISFVFVGLLFYLVHEFWTFREADSEFSAARLAANLAVLFTAGAVRVGLIALLEHMRTPAGIWASVYFAVGVAGSFTTNYALNRYIVFRR